jgi:uncharacterized membrane protein
MLSRLLRRREERGAIILLATVGVVVAMIAGGLAVDLGTLSVEGRSDQRIADLAALDAIRALPHDPTPVAQQSAHRNNFPYSNPGYALTVEWNDVSTGLFGTDASKLPTATQVRVTAKSPHNRVFAFSTVAPSGVNRAAIASVGNPSPCPPLPYVCVTSDGNPIGTVRVGSSAASLSSSDSKILDKLLTNTVGGSYTTDAVGWQGIAAGNVQFSRLRTALGYGAGSTDTVLDANLTYRQLLDATVNALNADGSPSSVAAATALATIASQVSAGAGVGLTLRNLLNVVGNVGGGADVADTTINVKDIVVGGVVLADSDHFASFNLTAADIPGLPGTSVTVKLGLIESPQEKSGAPGTDSSGAYRTTAHAAQVRLLVILNIPVDISSILGLSLGVATINLSVPYYLEGAGADASLDSMTCAAGNDTPTSVQIYGETTVAKTSLGTVADATMKDPSAVAVAATTTLGTVSVNLVLSSVTITVSTNNVVTSTFPGHSGMMTFTPPYTGTTSQAVPGTTTLALPTAAASDLTVTAALSGTQLLSIKNSLIAAINPASTLLNSLLVVPLQRALGLTLAQGDVWAPPAQHCNPVSYNVGGPSTPAALVPTLVG